VSLSDVLRPALTGLSDFGAPAALTDPLHGLLTEHTDTLGLPCHRRQQREGLCRLYNLASDMLNSFLGLDARPAVVTEQMITDALMDALNCQVHGDRFTALAVQRALLADCTVEDRHFYDQQPLVVHRTSRGQLAPDGMLDGRSFEPPAAVTHMFPLELKYLAKWQVPKAETLFNTACDSGDDRETVWGVGHDDPSRARSPHAAGDRPDCDDFWHTRKYNGLWVASALQLDVYVAYHAQILGRLGIPNDDTQPLRVCGLLIDALARPIDEQVAVTWRRWRTVPFAALLTAAATRYVELQESGSRSPAADLLRVLLARLLWL
jgi:hypothetical protein